MKTSFAFVFAVAVLALANAESPKEKIHRIQDECQEADAITPLAFCMNVKIGVLNANGDVDKDKLKEVLSKAPKHSPAVVDDFLAHCAQRNGSTAIEAAEAFNECMKDRYSFHFPGTRFTI